MLCLVQRVNTGLRAGLFISKAFSLSAVFPSVAFGSLQSFRKETDLAGMFFVPAFLFTGEKRNRFIITALGGGRGGGEKVSGSTSMPVCFSFSWSTLCYQQLGCHLEPSSSRPLPSPPQARSGRQRHS